MTNNKSLFTKVLAVILSCLMLFVSCASEGANGDGKNTAVTKLDDSTNMLDDEALSGETEYVSLDFLTENLDEAIPEGDQRLTGGLTLSVTDDGIDFMKSNMYLSEIGQFIEVTGINSIGIDISNISKDSKYSYDLMANINDKEVLALDAILDVGGQMLYFAVPTLTDAFLAVDFDALGIADAAVEFDQLQTSIALSTNTLMEKISAVDFELIEDVLNDYISFAVENVSPENQKQTSITVSGVSQNALVSSFVITEEEGNALAIAFFNKVKDDKELEKAFNEIIPVVNTYIGMIPELSRSVDELDDNFWGDTVLTAVDDLLEQLEAAKEYGFSDNTVKFNTYTADGELLGLDIEIDGDKISIYEATNGDKYAFEFIVDGQTIYSFDGKVKNGVANGKFNFADKITLTVDKFDVNAFEEGKLVMDVSVATSDLPRELDIPFDATFMLTVDVDGKDADYMKFAAFDEDGKELASLTYDFEITYEDGKIDVPAAIDCITDPEEYFALALDSADVFVENLLNAGVKEEFIYMIVFGLANA